jgi:hypothetical protein
MADGAAAGLNCGGRSENGAIGGGARRSRPAPCGAHRGGGGYGQPQGWTQNTEAREQSGAANYKVLGDSAVNVICCG